MVDKAATNLFCWWRVLFNIISYCLVIFDALPFLYNFTKKILFAIIFSVVQLPTFIHVLVVCTLGGFKVRSYSTR